MTQPERRYTVIYRAIADYADFIRKTRDARNERRAMHDEEQKGAKASTGANKVATEAEKVRAESTKRVGEETKKSSKQVTDSYDIARKSIEDITGSMRKMDAQSEGSSTKLKNLFKGAFDSIKGIRTPTIPAPEVEAPTIDTPSIDMPDVVPSANPDLDMAKDSVTADKLRIESTRQVGEETRKSSSMVQDAYALARGSIDDITGSYRDLGTESEASNNRMKNFFSGMVTGLRGVAAESEKTNDAMPSLATAFFDAAQNAGRNRQPGGIDHPDFQMPAAPSPASTPTPLPRAPSIISQVRIPSSAPQLGTTPNQPNQPPPQRRPSLPGMSWAPVRPAPSPSSSGGGGGGGGIPNLPRSGGGGGGPIKNSDSDPIKKMAKEFDGLLSKIGPVMAKFLTIGSAIAPAISAIGSLGAAAVGLATSLGQMVPALAALPVAFAAGATSIGALVVAFQPLMNIFKLYQAQQAATVKGSQNQAKEARQAAQAVVDARLSERSAENSYADAQVDVKRAQDNLNKAYKDATRNLEDLRDAQNANKLASEDASLSYAEAVENYKKVMADPNATLLDRQRALLQVKEADAARSDQAKKSKRDQEDLTEAEKKGVTGSDAVVDAKRAERDALLNVQKTQNDVAKSMDALKEALHEQANGGKTASAATDALNQALKNASPSTREFAKGLLGMSKPIKDIQTNVAEDFFKPLVGRLGDIKGFLPTINMLLTDAATALGKVASKGIEMITSGPWKADFKTISKSNATLIGLIGDAALHVADAFRNIAVAAIPFTTWVAEAIDRMAKGFDSWSVGTRASGGLVTALELAEKRISQFWVIIKNVGSGIFSLFKASGDFADWLIERIVILSGRFKDWSKEQEAPTSKFRTWLKEVQPTLTAVGSLIGAVATAFGHIASDPKNMETANHLLGILKTDILPPIEKILDSLGQSGMLDSIGKSLGTILDSIAAFLAGGGTGSLNAFVGVLGQFASILGGFLKIPGVIPVISGIAAALGTFAALRIITKLPIISQLIDGLSWIIKNKTGFTGALKGLPALLAGAFGFGGGGSGGSSSSTGGKNTPKLPGGGGAGLLNMAPTNSILTAILTAVNRILMEMGIAPVEHPNDSTSPTRKDSKSKTKTTVADAENDARRAANEAGQHRGTATKVAEDVAKDAGRFGKFGKLAGGIGTVADLGLNIFGLPGVSDVKNMFSGVKSMFGGGSKTAATDAAKAGTEATAKEGGSWFSKLFSSSSKGGTAAKAGTVAEDVGKVGKFARFGQLAEAADPFTIPGLVTGLVADSVWKGKDRKKPAAQLTRAGGAILTGAGIGAGIGSVVPVVGTAVGAAVGAVAGGAYSLYKDPGLRKTIGGAVSGAGDDISKVWSGAYEGFMRHVGSPVAGFFKNTLPNFFGGIGDFFTKTIPNVVGGFFTKTLPGWFHKAGEFFTALPGKIVEAIGAAAYDIQHFVTETIPNFFTKTIPHWFDNVKDSLVDAWHGVEDFFTDDVAGFFTKTIPGWFRSIGNGVKSAWKSVTTFFTKDVPHFFTTTIPAWFHAIGNGVKSAWKAVTTFFTKDVPNFFTKTIPAWFHHVVDGVKTGWKNVTTFFTKDVPAFFTKTIPTWFGKMVDGVKTGWNNAVTFFTKDVPDFFTNTIPKWFDGIGNAIKDKVVKPIADFFGGAWDFIKSHLSKGYNDEKNKTEGKYMGGEISGTFSGSEDSKIIRATPGEFVIRRAVTQKPQSREFLREYNEGRIDPTKALIGIRLADQKPSGPDPVLAGMSMMGAGLNRSIRNMTTVGAAAIPASSVATTVTNVYDYSKHVENNFYGDINSYNPKPERTSTSLRRHVEGLAFRIDEEDGR